MKKRGTTVLVTGASGFLGQHVVKMLQTRADHVQDIKVLDITPYVNRLDYEETKPVHATVGSVTDAKLVQDICKDVDCVMHVASYVDVSVFPDEEKSYKVNVEGTRNVVAACHKHNVKRLIYCSSGEVVKGRQNLYNATEDNTSRPSEFHFKAYGSTKRQAEDLVTAANCVSLSTISLRPIAVYGELEARLNTVITDSILARLTGYFLAVDLGKDVRISYCYAGNCAWAFVCADKALLDELKFKMATGNAYFIKDDTETPNHAELIIQIAEQAGADEKFEFGRNYIFHETQHTTDDSSNNNNDPQTFRDEIKTMNTFSHFMPDQRKLSRTAGLSRAANKPPTEVKDKTGTLPTLYLSTGSNAKLNSPLNFAPTDEDKAPSTSEIFGFDSENNQVLKSSTGSGNEWNLGTLSAKDVTANDSVQQIEFSQLGIMDGGMTNTTKEINYFNANTNDLTARNALFNTGNIFSTDSSGSSNNFDNTETVKNTLNQNNNIFGNTLTANDRFSLDDSSKFANNLFPTAKTTTTATSSSFAGNTLIKENGIVKPFPFGQLQGNPLKINKRVPTFKTKNNFVDHSRTPVLKVKSAFVDLSGRQNPNMKPLGTFVDMSDKLSSEIESTAKTTAMPTVAPSTTPEKTTTTQPSKPSPITKRTEPTIPGPVLTGLALPGVMSVNPSPTGNNANSAESSKANDLSPGRNGIISKSNVETGNSGTTISSGDKLNVDMLYPPAPFPVVDQSKLITNGGQAEINQPNVNKDGVNDTANGPSNAVAVSENERTNNLDSSAVNVNVDGNITGTFNYDYDMYADVATDISGELANNGQEGMDSRNTKLNARIEGMPKIPLVHKDTGDKDHFITDPNVQIINPNNNMVPNNVQTIPKNQNILTSQTGLQNIGQINNLQGVTDQRIFGNQNIAGNNFVNQNQFKNGQVIKNSFPQNTVRQNNQLTSTNAIADQNRMAQNGFNSNSINRLQQNMNSFSNDRNIPNTNVILNDRNNPNIIQNLPSGQSSMNSNTGGFASSDMANTRNEIIQRNSGFQTQNSQISNVKPLGNQLPTFPSNKQNNVVNWQTGIGNSLSNQMTPSQIQNNPTSMQGNPNQIQNPMNNAANRFEDNSNSQLNQISRQPVVGGSVPNMNMANQINNRVGINQANPLGLAERNSVNLNNVPQNRNFGSQPNVNTLSNNFQNRPIVSNGIRNGQPSRINNIPRNINNIPTTGNALSNNFNAGENIGTNFQMRSNLADPQFSNNQLNAIVLRNNIQRLGQNNAANIAQSVLQNGRNVFGNGQQISFGNIPNNARNVMNNVATFQGNVPQNPNNLQSNFINGDFRNGLSNGFRPNTVLNPINMPGVNRFPGNVPFNTNQLQRNALNSPFGPFR